MIDRLIILQKGKGQFSMRMELPENLKKEISVLYRHFFGNQVTGCSNCYHDAYFKLLRLNPKINKMTTNFKLRAGAILEAHGDPTKTCANSNLTDELAIFHLKNNPSCRRKFEKVPENLDELLGDKTAEKEVEKVPEKPKAGRPPKSDKTAEKEVEKPNSDIFEGNPE